MTTPWSHQMTFIARENQLVVSVIMMETFHGERPFFGCWMLKYAAIGPVVR
jgi:hypothetical protein